MVEPTMHIESIGFATVDQINPHRSSLFEGSVNRTSQPSRKISQEFDSIAGITQPANTVQELIDQSEKRIEQKLLKQLKDV